MWSSVCRRSMSGWRARTRRRAACALWRTCRRKKSFPRRSATRWTACWLASKPLALNGNVIEGIRLTLEHGRIVGIHADTDEDVLRQAIETDEGAHYLGEIALVPVNSPIAQSGLLYYNTLFDENAACHFAFGQAYPACVPGGDDLSEEELLAAAASMPSSSDARGFHGRHGGSVHHRHDERRARGR